MFILPEAVNITNGQKMSLGKKNPGLATRRLSREIRKYRTAPDSLNIYYSQWLVNASSCLTLNRTEK